MSRMTDEAAAIRAALPRQIEIMREARARAVAEGQDESVLADFDTLIRQGEGLLAQFHRQDGLDELARLSQEMGYD